MEVKSECVEVLGDPGFLTAIGPPIVRGATILRFGATLFRTGSLRSAIGAARVSSKAVLDVGKQGKHILGHNNYEVGKSILTHSNPQALLDKFAGTGQAVRGTIGEAGYIERVDFGTVIGQWVNPKTGEAVETTVGRIYYSKTGAHIVPTRPN